jgi:hypothetical protein
MHCPFAGLIRQQSNATLLKRFRGTSFFIAHASATGVGGRIFPLQGFNLAMGARSLAVRCAGCDTKEP